MQIGKNIKRIREEKGISGEELAIRIGLSRQYIFYLEKGYKKPTVENLYAISQELGVSMDELCGVNDIKQQSKKN